mmetsp:Transcript_100484/g.174421  ORF Transcript_100484/g.174421 Transcript_100484/m.174421 type:complete len:304 (-) Transcript_100484:61-972(-)
MDKVTIVLAACLACAAHGQQRHGSRKDAVPDPSKSVAMLLMALEPEGAFRSSVPQLASSPRSLRWQAIGRPARLAHLRMQEGTPTPSEETVETPAPAAPVTPPPKKILKQMDSKEYDLRTQKKKESKQGAGFNQYDPLLSLSVFLSRRFGILGGLSLVGILALTEGNEIVKALRGNEVKEVEGELVSLPSGLQYKDLIVSKSGDFPATGNVIGFDVKVSIGEKVLFDSKAGGKDAKPVAFKFGQRPFQNVICEGVEEGLKTMKPGGKRILFVPGNLGPPGVGVPGDVRLTYEIELKEVLPQYF